MAYQTLPNTFVSGSTIYSTAVSANMVALLQGYTVGTYDGWFADLKATELDINGTYYINSGGTANIGSTTMATATVAGDVALTGNCYKTAWTTWTTNPANLSVTAATGYYHSIGKSIHCSLHVSGKAASNGAIGVYLPVTAASAYQAYGWQPMLWLYSAGAAQNYPCLGSIAPDNNYMAIYPENGVASFVSSTTYEIWGEFWYEGA